MHRRHTLSFALALTTLACGQSHAPGTGDDAAAPAIDGGPAPVDAGSIADSAAPIDAPLALDAGTPIDAARDGGDPGVCEGLGPADCLAAGCAPDFDDACCPSCEPSGGCADCTNLEYHSCQPYAAACLGGPSCGTTPPWGCGPAAPLCEGAHVSDVDSCDRVGCVPGYPSSEGAPDPGVATCVPITATSCTVACRRLPPPCPTGTTAEGDGSCYTERCIPAFVCR